MGIEKKYTSSKLYLELFNCRNMASEIFQEYCKVLFLTAHQLQDNYYFHIFWRVGLLYFHFFTQLQIRRADL